MQSIPSLRKNITTLPEQPGIYLFKNHEGHTLYVGKAINLKKRVSSYFQTKKHDPKTTQLVERISAIDYRITVSEFDALLLEASLINTLKPKYNVVWRDDKHPLYIKITINEEFPRITTVHKEDEAKAIYFGPFPSGYIARLVLAKLRRVFPYCSQSRIGKRACFYTHIGLCNPCPSQIVSLPPKQYAEGKKLYRKNILQIKRILNGKSTAVIRILYNEMERLAKTEDFEEAAKKRDQIDHLRYVTQKHIPLQAYLADPLAPQQEFHQQAADFLGYLQHVHTRNPLYFPLPDRLRYIECIDISNNVGNQATGSIVGFVDGVPDKSRYRRFRIRAAATPNDTFMMREVLSRRLAHSEWSLPDMLIVDGGKAQVSTVMGTLKRLQISFPVIGLAKRLEELVIPVISDAIRFQIIRLKPGTPAFHLITRIRDEAHRFAITYHRYLRNKSVMSE